MRAIAFVALALLATSCAAPAFDPETVKGLPPRAAAPGVTHAEGTFEASDGVRLFEQSWAPRAATPAAALVIVHGLKDHSGRYSGLAADLARRGLAVHAFDLRGHARSEGDRVYVDRFEEYVDDLARFVERVRGRAPGRPIFLMGHSMGGSIVTLYTLDAKPPPAGIILSAPALKPGADISGALIRVTKILGAIFPTLAVMDLPNERFSRDPASVKEMGEDPLIYQGKGPARTASRLLGALERIEERLEEIRVPVLVVHGTADVLTDPEGSRALETRAASKDKTLLLYEGLYHDLLHEPERAAVAADIAGWLEAHAPRRPARR